jgi:hypothetical protein
MILLIAFTSLLPVMFFPLPSNAGGLWLAMGMMAGLAAQIDGRPTAERVITPRPAKIGGRYLAARSLS